MGKCNNCSKIGHKSYSYWELEKKKDKRPSGYKNTDKKIISSVNYYGIGTELILMELDDNYEFGIITIGDDMKFASDMLILRDLGVFITDTDKTSDTNFF